MAIRAPPRLHVGRTHRGIQRRDGTTSALWRQRHPLGCGDAALLPRELYRGHRGTVIERSPGKSGCTFSYSKRIEPPQHAEAPGVVGPLAGAAAPSVIGGPGRISSSRAFAGIAFSWPHLRPALVGPCIGAERMVAAVHRSQPPETRCRAPSVATSDGCRGIRYRECRKRAVSNPLNQAPRPAAPAVSRQRDKIGYLCPIANLLSAITRTGS